MEMNPRIKQLLQTLDAATEVCITTAEDIDNKDKNIYRVGRLLITYAPCTDVGLVGATRHEHFLEPEEWVADPHDTDQMQALGLPTMFGPAKTKKATKRKPQKRSEQQGMLASTIAAADGWHQAYDEGTGCFYYYNISLQVTQWEPPEEGYLPHLPPADELCNGALVAVTGCADNHLAVRQTNQQAAVAEACTPGQSGTQTQPRMRSLAEIEEELLQKGQTMPPDSTESSSNLASSANVRPLSQPGTLPLASTGMALPQGAGARISSTPLHQNGHTDSALGQSQQHTAHANTPGLPSIAANASVAAMRPPPGFGSPLPVTQSTVPLVEAAFSDPAILSAHRITAKPWHNDATRNDSTSLSAAPYSIEGNRPTPVRQPPGFGAPLVSPGQCAPGLSPAVPSAASFPLLQQRVGESGIPNRDGAGVHLAGQQVLVRPAEQQSATVQGPPPGFAPKDQPPPALLHDPAILVAVSSDRQLPPHSQISPVDALVHQSSAGMPASQTALTSGGFARTPQVATAATAHQSLQSQVASATPPLASLQPQVAPAAGAQTLLSPHGEPAFPSPPGFQPHTVRAAAGQSVVVPQPGSVAPSISPQGISPIAGQSNTPPQQLHMQAVATPSSATRMRTLQEIEQAMLQASASSPQFVPGAQERVAASGDITAQLSAQPTVSLDNGSSITSKFQHMHIQPPQTGPPVDDSLQQPPAPSELAHNRPPPGFGPLVPHLVPSPAALNPHPPPADLWQDMSSHHVSNYQSPWQHPPAYVHPAHQMWHMAQADGMIHMAQHPPQFQGVPHLHGPPMLQHPPGFQHPAPGQPHAAYAPGPIQSAQQPIMLESEPSLRDNLQFPPPGFENAAFPTDQQYATPVVSNGNGHVLLPRLGPGAQDANTIQSEHMTGTSAVSSLARPAGLSSPAAHNIPAPNVTPPPGFAHAIAAGPAPAVHRIRTTLPASLVAAAAAMAAGDAAQGNRPQTPASDVSTRPRTPEAHHSRPRMPASHNSSRPHTPDTVNHRPRTPRGNAAPQRPRTPRTPPTPDAEEDSKFWDEAYESVAKPANGHNSARVTLPPAVAAYVRTKLPRNCAKYWMQRYSLFHRYDDGIELDTEGWWSVTPEAIARHQAEKCKQYSSGLLAVEACCGCGGNVIQMAMTMPAVIGVDISATRIEMAQHNARVYGVQSRCEFLCVDFFKAAAFLKADVVFMSPPWGGPGYRHCDTFDVFEQLPHFVASLAHLLQVALGVVKEHGGVVACFLPRNTNLQQLRQLVPEGGVWEVERNLVNGKLKGITVYCCNWDGGHSAHRSD